MKRVAAIDGDRSIYRLIGTTGPLKQDGSEVTKESDNSLIHSQDHRMKRLAKTFKEQAAVPDQFRSFHFSRMVGKFEHGVHKFPSSF